MYLGAQPSRQKSQSTRPGAYSALLSFLNITSGDFAGNCLTHPKHLKSPMHCARLTRVPCTMAAGSGTGWAGIEGSHRGLTASAQVGETPVRPPPGAPNRRSEVRFAPNDAMIHSGHRCLSFFPVTGQLGAVCWPFYRVRCVRLHVARILPAGARARSSLALARVLACVLSVRPGIPRVYTQSTHS